MTEDQNRALILRFYEELWNTWRLDTADEILSPNISFRGTLGTTARGRDEFKAYVAQVRLAFPDWHNKIDELLTIRDRVVARLTWSGTHRGPLGDIAPTGNRVSYVGAAFFHIAGANIDEAWIVGDTQELWRALGLLAP
jgi:predicted ester cyclase